MRLGILAVQPVGTDYEFFKNVREESHNILASMAPEFIISSLRPGPEQWIAMHALKMGIKLVAGVPYDGFDSYWLTNYQSAREDLQNNAAFVHFISYPGELGGSVVDKNIKYYDWLVQSSDCLVVVNDNIYGYVLEAFKKFKTTKKPYVLIDHQVRPKGHK